MEININMYVENTHSPVSSLFSKQLNLSDFGFEKHVLKKDINTDIRPNRLLEFIKLSLNTQKLY